MRLTKHLVFVLFIAIQLLSGIDIYAQKNAGSKDSLATLSPAKKDTGKYKDPRPSRAAIMSACLPGLGQVYNKKYWKAPVIYAGFAGLGYVIVTENKIFQTYRTAYRSQLDTTIGNELLTQYSSTQLNILKEDARKWRDLSIIIASVWYAANIVDAMVDGHLYHFDVSDNLSMNVAPYINPFPNRMAFGGSLTFNFKYKK